MRDKESMDVFHMCEYEGENRETVAAPAVKRGQRKSLRSTEDSPRRSKQQREDAEDGSLQTSLNTTRF